jgi:bifunctional lysine-specific demethylase and histidyl-hydroxylase NO66
MADPARVLRLHAEGATIVLQSLHRWWPPLVRFCRDLEAALGHAVQANAYLTPAGAAGLAPHHDTHDVFVLQVHGAKHWTLRAPLVEHPLPRHRSSSEAAAAQPVLAEVDLEAGSCLYLPRGVVHSARAQEGSSLHLTIGVLATTAYDVVRRVLEQAAELPALRRPLPVGWADHPDAAEAAVKAALAELGAAVAATDPAAVAGELAVIYQAARRVDLEGALLDLDRSATLSDASVVVRRSAASVPMTTAADRTVLELPDRRVDLPAALAPALQVLLDGRPHAVDELAPWLAPGSRLVLVRRLLVEGVIRTAPSRDG